MERLLYLIHPESDGSLSTRNLEGLSAAKSAAQELEAQLQIGVWGDQIRPILDNLAGISPAPVLIVEDPAFKDGRFASDAAAMTALCRKAEPTLVFAASSPRIMRALAAVALRMKGAVDTHITDIDTSSGHLRIHRWYYRQRMQAEQNRQERPWFLVLESGIAPALQVEKGQVETVAVSCALTPKEMRTAVEGKQLPKGDSQTIKPDAEMLFVAGAGWTKKQSDGQIHADVAEKLILDFLHKSGASLGSTKSLVDLKGEGQAVLNFMTHLNQVGQTGSTPRHDKGIATCCHGEEPHVVGWRFIGERRAINLDANCGWAQGKADVLYVADAFQVLDEINRLLSE
ncbi:FAD-binding protein [candidate division KSB1 bacterium]|nr:FAD-binding protein [candidate division KSB1 bacterium]